MRKLLEYLVVGGIGLGGGYYWGMGKEEECKVVEGKEVKKLERGEAKQRAEKQGQADVVPCVDALALQQALTIGKEITWTPELSKEVGEEVVRPLIEEALERCGMPASHLYLDCSEVPCIAFIKEVRPIGDKSFQFSWKDCAKGLPRSSKSGFVAGMDTSTEQISVQVFDIVPASWISGDVNVEKRWKYRFDTSLELAQEEFQIQ